MEKTHPMKAFRPKLPWVLLLPFYSCFLTFWFIPLIQGGQMSLQSNVLVGESTYVGFDHYKNLLTDPLFFQAIRNTLVYATAIIITILPLALILAKLVRASFKKCQPWLCFCLILPGLTPPTVLAVLFLLFFYGRNGVLNELVVQPLGLTAINWLKDPDYILFGLVLQASWRWTGFITFFILSTLDSIPHVYYDAALLESQPNLRTFYWVTFPFIKNILLFSGLYLFIDAMVTFSGAYILLGASGGSEHSGLLLISYIYQLFHFGLFSSAVAVSFMILPTLLFILWLLIFYGPKLKKNGIDH